MRLALLALLTLTPYSPALAQQKTKAAPAQTSPDKKEAAQAAKKPSQPQEPAKQNPISAETAIAGLKAWDDTLSTLSAEFTQEVNFTEAGLKQKVEGELKYSKPNFLRIEHFKPARQLVISDKRDIWIYKPEDGQVIRTSWDSWRRAQGENFSGILDFGNYAPLVEKNRVEISCQPPRCSLVSLVFTPKDSPRSYTLSLALSATDYFPREAELTVDKTVIRTVLSGVEKNKTISPELFKFSPPKGVQVLEFRN